jgi:hypothetical protein
MQAVTGAVPKPPVQGNMTLQMLVHARKMVAPQPYVSRLAHSQVHHAAL